MAMRRHRDRSRSARISLIAGVFVLFSLLLIARLAILQIPSHEVYRKLVADQYTHQRSLQPQRGEIYVQDRTAPEGKLLVAANVQENIAYANPRAIEDADVIVRALMPIVRVEEDALRASLQQRDRSRVILARHLDDSQATALIAANLPGISVAKEVTRSYAKGTELGSVLGFLGFDGHARVGQYGIEGYWEEFLRGTEGDVRARDPWANFFPAAQAQIVNPVDGDDLELTIEEPIQSTACAALSRAVVQHGALRGSLIVMDPKTGAIFAMCDAPGYDPNDYAHVDDPSIYNNLAIHNAYEPGSVFKGITMAAALETGKVTPDATYTDEGSVTIGKYTIRNSDGKAHGVKTMTEVLEESLNTGAIEAVRRVGNSTFSDFVHAFGFGAPEGIELDSEASGDISLVDKQKDIYTATASYGQGITATPLQLITAYAAIANGGSLMKPFIVRRVVHADGSADESSPQLVRSVISRRTSTLLSAMLTSVVENGHGKSAQVRGYYIAGKTGTAQVASSNQAGYDPSKSIGTFIGFGPVENPRFVMLVRIDNPKDVKFAESTAAPLFGEIAKFLVSYLQIPPTRK